MSGAIKNKARNQIRGTGNINAKWFENRKSRNKKLSKQQKASRKRNR